MVMVPNFIWAMDLARNKPNYFYAEKLHITTNLECKMNILQAIQNHKEFFNELQENGLINKTNHRNLLIIEEYNRRGRGKPYGVSKKVIEELADRHNRDSKTISKIIFSNNNLHGE